jgi:hypothetical protein
MNRAQVRVNEFRIACMVVSDADENLAPNAGPMGPKHGAGRIAAAVEALISGPQRNHVIRVGSIADIEAVAKQQH